MKSGPNLGLVSCVKKGWIFPSYNHYNWSKLSIATSFKKGILSVLKKRMLAGKSSSVLHYMNMTNKMTNVDHINILMYIIQSFINDLEKDARKSSLRYSNQVLKKKCCIK